MTVYGTRRRWNTRERSCSGIVFSLPMRGTWASSNGQMRQIMSHYIAFALIGSLNQNVDPQPTALSTPACPACCSTMARHT